MNWVFEEAVKAPVVSENQVTSSWKEKKTWVKFAIYMLCVFRSFRENFSFFSRKKGGGCKVLVEESIFSYTKVYFLK